MVGAENQELLLRHSPGNRGKTEQGTHMLQAEETACLTPLRQVQSHSRRLISLKIVGDSQRAKDRKRKPGEAGKRGSMVLLCQNEVEKRLGRTSFSAHSRFMAARDAQCSSTMIWNSQAT